MSAPACLRAQVGAQVGGVHAHVRERGHPLRRREGQRPAERGVALGRGGLRDRPLHGRHRTVLEDPGGLTGPGIAHDDPAGDVLGGAGDLGRPQRRAVGQAHVAVEPVHEHRIPGRDRIDPLAARERRAGPALVVPVAAQDPFAGLPLEGVVLEPGDELLGRVGRPEVHAGQLEPAVGEMQVAVHEAGSHHAGAVGQHPGLGARQARDLGAVADRHDRISADGHGTHPWPSRVAGPDPAVDDEVRRPTARRAPAGGEPGGGQQRHGAGDLIHQAHGRLSGVW